MLLIRSVSPANAIVCKLIINIIKNFFTMPFYQSHNRKRKIKHRFVCNHKHTHTYFILTFLPESGECSSNCGRSSDLYNILYQESVLAFPSRLNRDSGRYKNKRQKPIYLQQRELLQTYTAFPFNR
jgi:hypothetical protein